MTKQIRDSLIYDGKDYYLNEEILEWYFYKHPERRPDLKAHCTALWRGYVATFEIKEGQLFVEDVSISEDTKANLKKIRELFPRNRKFEWYSGLIRIDEFRGEWDDENEGAMFEYLEIYKGDLIQKRTMDFEELEIFKAYQFEYFKTTEEYRKVYTIWKNNTPTMEDREIDEYIYGGLLKRYSNEMFDNEIACNR